MKTYMFLNFFPLLKGASESRIFKNLRFLKGWPPKTLKTSGKQLLLKLGRVWGPPPPRKIHPKIITFLPK